MPLPSLIEVVPPPGPVRAEIFVPGSKSMTNRALALAALSDSPPRLANVLLSEDTEVMIDCLSRLGMKLRVVPQADSPSSGEITFHSSCSIVDGGTPERPLALFVGNAGTAARFLTALVCLGKGCYRLTGTDRMHDRPQAGLFTALRELGYRIDSSNNKLPAVIYGEGPRPGATCAVRIEESSQFASALLLGATRGGWHITVEGEDPEEAPYVRMTSVLIGTFPRGGTFHIEPDASSASYFWGASWLLKGSDIKVANWNPESLQIDARFPEVLERFPQTLSRRTDLGDSIMTAIVLAPFADNPKTFVDLGRLRLQECERVQALHAELTKCGAQIIQDADSLKIFPGSLKGAEIETYDDHRMAMCFAMLGLLVPGMRLRNPSCVRKTFPDFFSQLSGLGAAILDENGRPLAGSDLVA